MLQIMANSQAQVEVPICWFRFVVSNIYGVLDAIYCNILAELPS